MKHKTFHIFLLLTFLLLGFSGSVKASVEQKSHVRKDKVERIEQKENKGDALLTDAQNIYRICNSRPQRIVNPWGCEYPTPQTPHSKILLTNKYFNQLQLLYRAQPRQESAPIHFSVASRYYVICLRRLLC